MEETCGKREGRRYIIFGTFLWEKTNLHAKMCLTKLSKGPGVIHQLTISKNENQVISLVLTLMKQSFIETITLNIRYYFEKKYLV